MLPKLSAVAALALAHPCAPSVVQGTIVSIAKAKSGLHALALRDSWAAAARFVPESPGRRDRARDRANCRSALRCRSWSDAGEQRYALLSAPIDGSAAARGDRSVSEAA
jgi:hypothetical protein